MGILLVSQTVFSWAGPVFAEEISQVEEQRAWSQAGEQSGSGPSSQTALPMARTLPM